MALTLLEKLWATAFDCRSWRRISSPVRRSASFERSRRPRFSRAQSPRLAAAPSRAYLCDRRPYRGDALERGCRIRAACTTTTPKTSGTTPPSMVSGYLMWAMPITASFTSSRPSRDWRFPGFTVACGDSHTCTLGAMGCARLGHRPIGAGACAGDPGERTAAARRNAHQSCRLFARWRLSEGRDLAFDRASRRSRGGGICR